MSTSNSEKRKYLKISSILTRLKEFQDRYGDLPIRIQLAGVNTKTLISGVRYNAPRNGQTESVFIVPKYDVMGIVNEMAGTNSLVKQIADLRLLFVQLAQTMIQVKSTLEVIQKRGGKITSVREQFAKLYDVAKNIRDNLNYIRDFDKNLAAVIEEPYKEADYAATFMHHIDEDMTDAGFAALITDGVGEKTSVQRLAVYVEIIRKINAEIANRKRRIAALENRLAVNDNSHESMNAKQLIGRSESIVETLLARRDYIFKRFSALKKSVHVTMNQFSDEISKLYDEQPDSRAQKRG